MLYVLKKQETLIESLNLTLDEVKQELEAAQKNNEEMRVEMKEIRAVLANMNQQMIDLRASLDQERKAQKKKLAKAGIFGAFAGAGLAAALLLIF